MSNAKTELLKVLINKPEVKCAKITQGEKWWDEEDEIEEYILKIGHTKEEYNDFLEKLDFEYSSDYGGQNLFGILWFKDGTWLDRGEYEGSEWWQHQTCPDITDDLI